MLSCTVFQASLTCEFSGSMDEASRKASFAFSTSSLWKDSKASLTSREMCADESLEAISSKYHTDRSNSSKQSNCAEVMFRNVGLKVERCRKLYRHFTKYLTTS